MIEQIFLKGIHEKYSVADGRRIFVAKKWPHDIDKSTAMIDEWVKTLAPSNIIAKAMENNAIGVCSFVKAYWLELEMNTHLDPFILRIQNQSIITLVHSHNENAKLISKVLKDYLEEVISLYREI